MRDMGVNSIAANTVLELTSNNTFQYSTCGIMAAGQFSFDADTLFLNSLEIYKYIDVDSFEVSSFSSYPYYKNTLKFYKLNENLIKSDNDLVTILYRQ